MNHDRLLKTLFDLIDIESPSRHEAAMAAHCKVMLEDMGFAVRFDETQKETGSDTGNLIAHLPGTVPGHIMLSAHMDTVEPGGPIEPVIVTELRETPEGVCEVEVLRSAGETILSSDDKAGVAAILEGVRATVEQGLPRPDITVLLTVCEELSLVGAHAVASDAFEGDVPCFVLDADGEPGSIIMGAPYHYSFLAHFHGKAAHAGVEPEHGKSAIQMAAEAIVRMPLGRIDECTTANVGPIEGGVETNIVAADCVLRGECRSLYQDRVEAQQKAMDRALREGADVLAGGFEILWSQDYPGILHEKDDPIVNHLVAAIESIGLTPRFVNSGGGADANVLGEKGTCAITLGIGMTNFHTPEEHILLADLDNDARLVEAIIAEYAR